MAEVESEDFRRGLAVACVRINRAHFRPWVELSDLAKTAGGLTQKELRAALDTLGPRRLVSYADSDDSAVVTSKPAPAIRRTTRPEPPPGMKWCSKGQHFVAIIDPTTGTSGFGRNKARPDGLADYCMADMKKYWEKPRR